MDMIEENGGYEKAEGIPVTVCRNTGELCNFVEDSKSGNTVCTTCGDILGGVGNRFIDQTAEWRHFADTPDTKDRLAGTVDKYIGSTSTSIAPAKGPRNGQQQPGSTIVTLHHQQKFTKTQKNLMEVFAKIKQFTTQLKINETTNETCKGIYNEFIKSRGGERGARVEALISATIFVACKKDGVSRSIREISSVTGVSEHDIRKGYGLISKFVTTVPMGASKQSSEIVGRIREGLELPFVVQTVGEAAAKIAAGVVEGREPATIAASALLSVLVFLTEKGAVGVMRSDADVGAQAKMAPGTIRAAFNLLRKDAPTLAEEALTQSGLPLQIVLDRIAQDGAAKR